MGSLRSQVLFGLVLCLERSAPVEEESGQKTLDRVRSMVEVRKSRTRRHCQLKCLQHRHRHRTGRHYEHRSCSINTGTGQSLTTNSGLQHRHRHRTGPHYEQWCSRHRPSLRTVVYNIDIGTGLALITPQRFYSSKHYRLSLRAVVYSIDMTQAHDWSSLRTVAYGIDTGTGLALTTISGLQHRHRHRTGPHYEQWSTAWTQTQDWPS